MEQDKRIDSILRKIEMLSQRQTSFQKDIELLKAEAQQLEWELSNVQKLAEKPPLVVPIIKPLATENPVEIHVPDVEITPKPVEIAERLQKTSPIRPPQYKVPSTPSDLEKFIGENLSNKIGIVITVLGIAVGVKYAIDHELISPLMRIILGYVLGFGLFGVSVKLRPKYEDLSAVILGGALAALYFVTYAAYDLYLLIPQSLAFLMMFVITIFTVVAALNYNRQIIAIGGLIGAYFIPFLLSNNTDNVVFLFTYMVIVNVGILFISFKKNWTILYYLAFVITWIIFAQWSLFQSHKDKLAISMTFGTLFFAIFYTAFLAYKLIKNEQFTVKNTMFLLANAFIYYGVSYNVLEINAQTQAFLGFFTLLNAVIHFGVSTVIYRRELADRNLFFLVSGLVLVFITMAICVEFDGHYVTILWATEMALLFWIGRTKGVPAYEKLSYPLWILTLLSLYDDWKTGYVSLQDYIYFPIENVYPILNIYFFTTLIVISCFIFVYKIHNNSPLNDDKNNFLNKITPFLQTIMSGLIYLLFFNEINNYFTQNYINSYQLIGNAEGSYIQNEDILNFKTVWLINYSLLFCGLCSWINVKYIKNIKFAYITTVLNLLTIFIFLSVGLFTLSALKNSYLYNYNSNYFPKTINYLLIRYISYVLVGFSLFNLWKNKQLFFQEDNNILRAFDIMLNIVILITASAEMVHWLELHGNTHAYKWAISVLWGVYAVGLIVYGINKNKKHLRFMGLVLFALTLIKLLLYDMAGLDTISKTIVMISLGVLLLIVSYFYNKYKNDTPQ